MKYIDMENWRRKQHFDFFQRADYPQYNICLDIDVTGFTKFVKRNGLSFYYSMIFSATTVINGLENFRYRLREGKVILHDMVHPSFTDMDRNSGDDLFKVVTIEMNDDIKEFVKIAKEISANQKDYFPAEMFKGRDDLVYITCLPWISFNHISHTISLDKNDSVPRVSWGKYYMQGDRVLLPFSVQVSHLLADGFHVAVYIEKLQEYINDLN